MEASRWWWVWLVTGFLWILISLVLLQFDDTSVRTVGVIVGIMLLFAGMEYIALGVLAEGWKWVWFALGGLLILGGLFALFNPATAFATVADMLGFLFGLIAIVWIVQALAVRNVDSLWWLHLTAGILMLIVAFWVGGQFFFTKAYTLLVFAGIWAMLRGFLNIIQAFQIRMLGKVAAEF